MNNKNFMAFMMLVACAIHHNANSMFNNTPRQEPQSSQVDLTRSLSSIIKSLSPVFVPAIGLHAAFTYFILLGPKSIKRFGISIYRPGHMPVFMNDAQVIRRSPGMNRKTISTHGLVSCRSIVLYTTYTSGDKRVLMTHYSRGNDQVHLSEFARYVKQAASEMEPAALDKSKLVVILPKPTPFWGERDNMQQDDDECRKLYEMFKQIAHNEFSDAIDIEQVLYDIPPPGKTHYAGEIYVTLSDEQASSLRMQSLTHDVTIYLDE